MLNNKYPENTQHKEREHISFCYQKITWTWMDGGITASDDWQEMVIPAERLVHGISGQRLKDWKTVGSLEIRPVKGSDLTRIIFADFRWVDRKAGR